MEVINGRYELRREIRRGGFGVTWYAWDNNLEMPVAVKEFSDPDPDHRRRFIHEARTLARFSGSRGIVNVRDYLETGEKAYMVMEYLDGEDLSTYVDRKGRLSLEETMELLLPVMHVLKRLHDAGVLHRDVSPDNIRLTGEGEVKLLDFGSVTVLTSENLTRTVTVKPGYAPIEQYSGQDGQGAWTDIYSLCATIYKCITGNKPVDSLARSLHDDLARPSELGVEIGPEEEAALMKGLSIRPGDRYGSIDEFAAAMEQRKTDPAEAAEEREISELAARAFNDDSGMPAQAENRADADERSPEEIKPEIKTAAPESAAAKKEAMRTAEARFAAAARTSAPSGSRRERKKGKTMALILLLFAAAAAAVTFLVLRGGELPVPTGSAEGIQYTSGNSYVRFSGIEITDGEIRFVENKEAVETVYFDSCDISDEMIGKMADWSHVREMQFYNNVGYSSLDPLTGSAALEALALTSYEDPVAGDQLITKDFSEKLTGFTINCPRLEGTTDFIRHMPGLESLTFYVDEDGCDMAFLDSLPNLKYIYIQHQTMDEEACSHLFGHPMLTTVNLSDTGMASLDWAKECAGLYNLEAANSLVSDLSPLADHKELAFLDLSGSRISDLTPLANCGALYNLDVSRTNVAGLAGLEGHDSLTILDISHCGVSDLSPLSGSGLVTLKASYNKIASLDPLSSCTSLSGLNVNGNALTELGACRDMIKLTDLRAARNHITDISGIKNCTQIKNLLLSGNEITDISCLSNDFLNLEILDISDNRIYDIGALSGCAALKAIAADNNEILSIESLSGKENLYAVLLSGNNLTDISPLADSMGVLSYLDIGGNFVSDVSILSNLSVKRVWLYMENNNISDLHYLPKHLSYQKMILYGNPVTDISFAADMDSVGYSDLYLTYHENLDYAALGGSGFKYSTVLVDVPADKKAGVLSRFKEGSSWQEPTFKTSEEADEDMTAYRKEIRSTITGDSDDAEDGSAE